jgi:membrane protease YdiL (CAAX protease family)
MKAPANASDSDTGDSHDTSGTFKKNMKDIHILHPRDESSPGSEGNPMSLTEDSHELAESDIMSGKIYPSGPGRKTLPELGMDKPDQTGRINAARSFISGQKIRFAVFFKALTIPRDVEAITEITVDQQLEQTTKRFHDLALIMTFCALAVSLYSLLYAGISYFSIRIPSFGYSIAIEAVAVVMCIIVYRRTDFRLIDIGIFPTAKQLKPSLISGLAIAVSVVATLITVKYLLAGYGIMLNKGRPFFFWDPVWGKFCYIFTALLQEVVIRTLQCSLKQTLPFKRNVAASVIISSVCFGALHISYGFHYMVLAIGACIILGIFFEKTKNFWGCSIIHYALGISAKVLGLQ